MRLPVIPAIAHRGLHDERRGIVENTASAFEAAIRSRYAIETDIQAAEGGEPVIFHDWRLERLTNGKGELRNFSPAMLRKLSMRGTADRILTLGEFLELIGRRTTVFLEIKSAGGNDRTLERRIGKHLADYRGLVSVMGFDPGCLRAMRQLAPQIPRGLSSYCFARLPKLHLSPADCFRLTHMLDIHGIAPSFLTYKINDLPAMERGLRRCYPDLPIITWTVRTLEDRRKAALYADGMIFEGFMPERAEIR